MKKNIKLIIIITFLVIGSMLLHFVIFGVTYAGMLLFGLVDITDLKWSLSVDYISSIYTHSTSRLVEHNLDLQWYDTLEEALQNDELVKDGKSKIDFQEGDVVELLQAQTDNRLAVLYTRTPKEGDITHILCLLVEIKDGKYSQPFEYLIYGNEPGYTLLVSNRPDHHYDCDDGIVFYILNESVMWDTFFGNQQDQIPVVFGMWSDKNEIESLTVAGQSPKIIPVVAEEDTRYFWYFDKVDWLDRLEEIDRSNFTYGQIIDLLEIKYEKTPKWWRLK